MPYVHAELKRLAAHYMSGEQVGHTLQSTALVNEAYLRLVDVELPLESRNHFLAIAAKIMRRILVDHARSKGRKKRGDGVAPLSFDESLALCEDSDPRITDLDDALNNLEQF